MYFDTVGNRKGNVLMMEEIKAIQMKCQVNKNNDGGGIFLMRHMECLWAIILQNGIVHWEGI